MPVIVPRIDDRRYEDILREALARIPVHTPEWTNHNDSDPGVTLLQLFAFMTESLLYRSNLVPERNRWKFLQLLGVSLRPASAARGVVTIANERGPSQTLTLSPGVPAAAGRIGFVTTNGLDVLPIDGRVFYRRQLTGDDATKASLVYGQLFGSFAGDDTALEFYETTPFDPPASAAALAALDLGGTQTVDHTAWIALLARPIDAGRRDAVREELAGKTLTLGLMPIAAAAERVIHPGGARASAPAVPLTFHLSTGRMSGGQPEYLALEARLDANPLEDLTLVQLTLPSAGDIHWWDDLDPTEEGVGDLPPTLDDAAQRARLLAWLRVRVPPSSDGIASAGTLARFSWLGINAARLSQRVDVAGEQIGTGTGEPDQSFTLVNTPVLADSVRLMVGAEPYARTDDLLAAKPEVPVRDPALPPGTPAPPTGDPRVFKVDAESGRITFGDGLRGKRPPAGAVLFAAYAYGGGRAGNVGVGEVKSSAALPAGFRLVNPLPTWGGADGQTVGEAEREIPRVMRHANRAVSDEDFRDIVWSTPGVELGRVEVLPLFDPSSGAPSPAPGVVTVLVIPIDVTYSGAPVPDQFFLRAVCAYLEPRRVLTTEVHVRGPQYVGISVSIGIDVVPGRDVANVREQVRAAIRRFLSPLAGGVDERGWPLDTVVEDRELLVRAARVDGVAKVRQVLIWTTDDGAARTTVAIAGLQLPRLDRVTVALGDAEDVTTTPGAPGVPSTKRLPVPVVPRVC